MKKKLLKDYKHTLADNKKFKINQIISLINEKIWKYRKKKKKIIENSISEAAWVIDFEYIFNASILRGNGEYEQKEIIRDICDEVLHWNVSQEEVRLAIRNLKPGKALGIAGIFNKILDISEAKIVFLLAKHFKTRFRQRIFPIRTL